MNLFDRLIDLGIWMLAKVREDERRPSAALLVVARIELPAVDLLDPGNEVLDETEDDLRSEPALPKPPRHVSVGLQGRQQFSAVTSLTMNHDAGVLW